jgi:hypothetical protein
MANGEKVQRSWLVYSRKYDRIYCFCCKIFSKSSIGLSNNGSNDWGHLTQQIKRHESSQDHFETFNKWVDLAARLKSSNTIDMLSQQQIQKEIEHWDNLLKRIISTIIMMAKQNLSFRGSSDKIFCENNGNFLKIMELLGEFDPVLKIHLERCRNKPNSPHYLGKNIQNEVIELIGTSVKTAILQEIKAAVYYSCIVDCTPDISNKEQMSVVLRYVKIQSKTFDTPALVQIKESFVGFFEIRDTTGLGISKEIMDSIKNDGNSF